MSNLRVCYLPLSAVAFFRLSCGAQLLCKYRRCQTHKHMHTHTHVMSKTLWAAPALLEELSARFGMLHLAPLDLVRWRLWLPLSTLRSALLEVPAWSWGGGRAAADTVTSTQ
ncbi:hypothetical protein TcCL_Unassigned00607 [Trypanosoma cruzi]|nr:hypothetical protein TcCL_Unassigned00607 [Trypanosoma cruzi]